jgi:ligand-binding sensor protein
VEGATNGPETVTCFAGLSDTAVPIKLGEKTIGFLQTGQVAVEEAPSEAQFSGITRQIIEWGSHIDVKQLRKDYFNSKMLSRSQYAGAVRLRLYLGRIPGNCARPGEGRGLGAF